MVRPSAFSHESLAQQYHALLEVTESIAAHHDLSELFRDLAQKLPPVVQCSSVALGLHNAARHTMQMHILEHVGPGPLTPDMEYPIDEVPGGWVWQHQQSLICEDVQNEPRFPKVMPLIREAGIRSFCTVPLTTARRRIGAMGVGTTELHRYDAAEIEFLHQAAKQVAVAVDNALNYERARAAERDLRLLLEINNAVVSRLELGELLRTISSSLRRVIPHDLAGLTLYDPEARHLIAHTLDFPHNQEFVAAGVPIPLEGTPEGLAFTSREPVLIRKLNLEEFPADIVKRAAAEGLQSGCAVPLIAKGEVLGTLSVVSLQERAFTDEHARLLKEIGLQVAIAVENTLNFERARASERRYMKERDRLRLLMDVTNNLTSNLQLRDLLQATVASVRRVMHCDLVTVHLPNDDRTQLQTFVMDCSDSEWMLPDDQWQPVEGTLEGHVFSSGKPMIAARLDSVQFPREAKALEALGIVGGCIVPLLHRGRVLGNMGLGRKQEVPYSDEEVDFLMQFGTQLAIAIENALAYGQVSGLKDRLTREKHYLEDEIRTEHNFEEIIGESPALKQVLKQIKIVAPTDSTVLILGETGTGKELIARAIHNRSHRRERTFIKMNCAAIPTGLLESELFGHERGAFTGAIATKIGRFELADGGTLFLDEVGDIPLELQSKLLRVLQEQEFERLGSTRTVKVKVRLVAATHQDLPGMVSRKEFRSDLYYRLNVFPLKVPPLRERRDDIPVLVRHFTQKFARLLNRPIERIPEDTMNALVANGWPGNVRELENFIERAVILSQERHLYVPLAELSSFASPSHQAVDSLEGTEREHILKILKASKWVLGGPSGAAFKLGMKRTTLQSKMQRLGITRPL
jgi:formate hydrogenlyase transcriptional activator